MCSSDLGQFKFALVRGDTGATTWSHDGTSVNALPPASSVSLPTSSGLYSVDLGDTNIANISLAIPLSALSAPSVGLRIWFNDGAHGLQKLSPDVRLASVPYSMVAASVPDGSITAAQLGAGTVSGSVIGGVGCGHAQCVWHGWRGGLPAGGEFSKVPGARGCRDQSFRRCRMAFIRTPSTSGATREEFGAVS